MADQKPPTTTETAATAVQHKCGGAETTKQTPTISETAATDMSSLDEVLSPIQYSACAFIVHVMIATTHRTF